MGKINIKGGTPVGSESLCRTCGWAHIMTGYRESEMVVICEEVAPNIIVPFKVVECTCYYDKNRPTRAQMEKLAIEISPRRLAKPVGFRTRLTTILDEDTDDAEDQIESTE